MPDYKSLLKSFIIGSVLTFITASPNFAMMDGCEAGGDAQYRAPAVMRGVLRWEDANTPQKELIFKAFTCVNQLRFSLKNLVDRCNHLANSVDEDTFQSDVKGYAHSEITQDLTTLQESIKNLPQALAYYEANKERIDLGVLRALHIRRQLGLITEEARTIFQPILGVSVDCLLTSRASIQDFLTSQLGPVQQRFQKRALFNQTSEAWRSFLYPEYDGVSGVAPKALTPAEITALQAMEDTLQENVRTHQKEAVDDHDCQMAHQATELMRQAREEEDARHHIMLEEFRRSADGLFFQDLETLYSETLLSPPLEGRDESVLRFYTADILSHLNILLQRDHILDHLINLHGITGHVADPHGFSTLQDIDRWLEGTFEDRVVKGLFHGGLRTLWKHTIPDKEFPTISPKDAFLSLLGVLHRIHQTFPTDERVNQTVLQTYFWIVDQNGACPVGLLGRSFLLGEALSKLLVMGLERPFVK